AHCLLYARRWRFLRRYAFGKMLGVKHPARAVEVEEDVRSDVPPQPTFLTREGRAQLEAELKHLRSAKRQEVALRIKRAAELGDRSENSEYEDAKNEQAFVEGRIQELDLLLRNVELIDDPAQARHEVVVLGSTVEVVDLATNESVIYTIVGPVEVDLAKGRIS